MEKLQGGRLDFVSEEEEGIFHSLLLRQEAVAEKLERQEAKLRDLIQQVLTSQQGVGNDVNQFAGLAGLMPTWKCDSLRLEPVVADFDDVNDVNKDFAAAATRDFGPMSEDFDVNFDVNALDSSGDSGANWVRNISHESKASNLPQSYSSAEMDRRDTAMMATASLHRRRFSENKAPEEAPKIKSHISVANFVKAVNHPYFEATFSVIVLLNAVFIGIDTEINLHMEGARSWELQVINMIFALLFLVEWILRFSAAGRWFLWDDNWTWNWLDTFVVIASLWDVVNDLLQSLAGTENARPVAGLSGVKVFRFLRITRILKAIQFARVLRFVMALRTLVTSIFSTVKSLMWALLLLGLIVYVFSVIFVQVVNDYIDQESIPLMPDELLKASEKHYSSLSACMLSLFMSIADGVSWQEVLAPVKFIGGHWVLVFLFFISFTQFAVLNVVTGVFCQSAIESAQHDHATMMQSMVNNKETHLKKVKQLFSKMGASDLGCITFSMFEDKINDPDVRAFFESLDLDVWDAWAFFKLLDSDGGGIVEVEEFFMGCLRFRGNARAMDVARIIQDQRWLISHVSQFETFLEAELGLLKEELLHATKSSQTIGELPALKSPHGQKTP